MPRPCINDCGRDVSDGSALEECKTCRSAWYYWKKATARKILKRREQLTVMANRIANHFNSKGEKKP